MSLTRHMSHHVSSQHFRESAHFTAEKTDVPKILQLVSLEQHLKPKSTSKSFAFSTIYTALPTARRESSESSTEDRLTILVLWEMKFICTLFFWTPLCQTRGRISGHCSGAKSVKAWAAGGGRSKASPQRTSLEGGLLADWGEVQTARRGEAGDNSARQGTLELEERLSS